MAFYIYVKGDPQRQSLTITSLLFPDSLDSNGAIW